MTKNILAAIGLVALAKMGYEFYVHYAAPKKKHEHLLRRALNPMNLD